MSDKWIPETLIFAAGGTRHLLSLGFLVRLEDEGILRGVNSICCCSTGAIIGLLIACGYTIREIITVFVEMEFIKSITDFDVRMMISSSNLDYDETLVNTLTELVMIKFGYVPSLQELYFATGISLSIVAFDYNTKKTKILDKDEESSLSIVDAVIYSCALPKMYHKHLYKGMNLTEGSLASAYPLSFVDKSKNILGFFISDDHRDETPNFVNYYNDIVSLFMLEQFNRETRDHPRNQRHIHLSCDRIISPDDKAHAIMKGHDQAEKWLKKV